MTLLFLVLGCGHSYRCCDDGSVGTCYCPAGANCAEAVPFEEGEDGTCTIGSSDGGDTDTDTDTDCMDTGTTVYVKAEFAVAGGTFDAATLGYHFSRGCLGECEVIGNLRLDGPAPSGCPDCEWSFDLGPLEEGVASGSGCAGFGVDDGYLDGTWEYSWGFAAAFDYYMPYGEPALRLEDVLLTYGEAGWNPTAFNYGGVSDVEWDGATLRAQWNPAGRGWE